MEKLIIIGSGPAGLSAAIYGSRALLNPLVIEGIPGGQLMLTTEVENYPGFENPIMGPELMDQFKKQALRFGTRFQSANVISVKKEEDSIVLNLSDNTVLKTQTLLITTGADAKWLGLESEQRLRGKGVSACATCDGFFFKDKEIVVVGGGDSAMEESLYLSKFAKKVTIVHRRSEFSASKIMQERVFANEKIEILFNSQIVEVLGTNKVEGVKLDTNGSISDFKTEGLFIAIGHSPATSFLKDSGVRLDEKGYIITKETASFDNLDIVSEYKLPYRYSTNIEGIFAAGDCVDHLYRQAVTASGMAVSALLEIEKYLS
jgi:thioredoxin reductase (NADPH)